MTYTIKDTKKLDNASYCFENNKGILTLYMIDPFKWGKNSLYSDYCKYNDLEHFELIEKKIAIYFYLILDENINMLLDEGNILNKIIIKYQHMYLIPSNKGFEFFFDKISNEVKKYEQRSKYPISFETEYLKETMSLEEYEKSILDDFLNHKDDFEFHTNIQTSNEIDDIRYEYINDFGIVTMTILDNLGWEQEYLNSSLINNEHATLISNKMNHYLNAILFGSWHYLAEKDNINQIKIKYLHIDELPNTPIIHNFLLNVEYNLEKLKSHFFCDVIFECKKIK